MAYPLQAKLLRVLQEGVIERIGSNKPVKVDVRVVSSTNRDLTAAMAAGTFREDLYYRLSVVAIRMPSLRERVDDIPLLVDHFLDRHCRRLGRRQPTIDRAVRSAFSLYAWPGNIRELENVIERAVVLDRDGVIGLDDLPARLRAGQQGIGRLRIELPDEGLSLETVERDLLKAALEKHDWNQTRAAAYLDITRSALLYRMQKFGLERPKHDADADTCGTPVA
jgi:two-component system, NtrC family, response regulator